MFNLLSHSTDTLDRVLQWVNAHIPRHFHLNALGGATCAVLLWVVIARSLRWRRYRAIHRKYGPKWDNGRGEITPEEAQKILHESSLFDMPWLLNYALAFALFKTYAIVSGCMRAVS